MEYEVIYEIFNSCSGNQMRDIFFEEREFSSPEDIEPFIREKHKNTIGDIDKTELDGGVIIIDFTVGNVPQRYTFTPIG